MQIYMKLIDVFRIRQGWCCPAAPILPQDISSMLHKFFVMDPLEVVRKENCGALISTKPLSGLLKSLSWKLSRDLPLKAKRFFGEKIRSQLVELRELAEISSKDGVLEHKLTLDMTYVEFGNYKLRVRS